MKHLLLLVALIFAGATAMAQNRPESFNYKRGLEGIQNENLDEALEYFNKVLKENTKNGYSYSWNFQEYKTAEATFNFEWTDYTSTFMIMDATSAMAQVQEEIGIQIHGILGIQFLLEHKWLLLLHSAIR